MAQRKPRRGEMPVLPCHRPENKPPRATFQPAIVLGTIVAMIGGVIGCVISLIDSLLPKPGGGDR